MSGETHWRTVTNEYECYHGARVTFTTRVSPDGTMTRECEIAPHKGATIRLDEDSTYEVAIVLREHAGRPA